MRRLVSFVLFFVLASCALCGSAGAARFYMPSYGGSPETIGGFELSPDGSLTTISGSPFQAEEGGPGGILGLGFTPDGRRAASNFLFTGGIQGYSLAPDGAISMTNSFTSASATGIAVSPEGHFAFMPTRNPVAEGVTRFSIADDGSLTRLEPPSGTGESYGVAITPDGRFLYTTKAGNIAGFSIGGDGSLTSLGSTSQSAEYLGVSPDGRFLFAVYGGGFRTLAIAPDGTLTPVGAPATLGGSVGYFGIAPDGSYAYVPDYNNDLIDVIGIAADGTPSLIGGPAVNKPEAVSVAPDGRHLVFYKAEGSYGIGSAAIGLGGQVTVLPSFIDFETGEPEPLVFQPQPTPVARFGAVAAAAGEATRFDAGASQRAARYDWNFGDGTALADGGATPTHTYSNPGSYQVTLVVTDAQGCSLRQVYTGQSTVCPGGGAARSADSVVVPPPKKANPVPKKKKKKSNPVPVLGKVRVVPTKFAPKVRGVKPGKVPLGTTFRYTVSEAASVRFKIERKQGKRFKKLGSRPQAAKKGANKLKWNGKLKGKALLPGRYRATVVAIDKEGGRAVPKKVGFRILPVPPSR